MFFWLSFFGLRGEIPPNLSLLYMDLIKFVKIFLIHQYLSGPLENTLDLTLHS